MWTSQIPIESIFGTAEDGEEDDGLHYAYD